MTITRLFTKTFDEVMKAKGFKRKNRLYFKLVGEILQGVVIKATNPFEICFKALPYWAPQVLDKMFPLYKGYWAEINVFSISSTDYYWKDDVEYNTFYMNECLKIAENYIFPYFESITDIDSYIAAVSDFWQGRTPEEERLRYITLQIDGQEQWGTAAEVNVFWRIFGQETQYALLNKAYLDKSFDSAKELFEYVFSKQQLIEPWNDFYCGVFLEKMKQGDYTAVEAIIQEQKALKRKRLSEELGICIFPD